MHSYKKPYSDKFATLLLKYSNRLLIETIPFICVPENGLSKAALSLCYDDFSLTAWQLFTFAMSGLGNIKQAFLFQHIERKLTFAGME